VAAELGLPRDVIVAGGAGDNAAGAVGVGVIGPGDAFLSLGTSGVYFVANARFAPNPERAVHAFCHCLPGAWHQMAVSLSAASALTWVSAVTGAGSEASLLAEVEAQDREPRVLFLPYLSGVRRARISAGPFWKASPSPSPTGRMRCWQRGLGSGASP
jgi:xylulokinase